MIREIRLCNCILCNSPAKLKWVDALVNVTYAVSCIGLDCVQSVQISTDPYLVNSPDHDKSALIVSVAWNMLNQ